MADVKKPVDVRAEEIAALKRQMEEMQKRLEELSAAAPAADSSEEASVDERGEAKPENVGSAGAEDVEPVNAAVDQASDSDDVEGSGPSDDDASAGVEEVEGPAIEVEPVEGPRSEPHVIDAPSSSDVYQPPSSAEAQKDASVSQAAQQAYASPAQQPQQAPYESAQGTFIGQPGPDPSAAQGAQQPHDPYGGAYVGQQVPFGQAQQGYQQAQQPYGYGYGYGTPQGSYQQPVVRTKDHVAAGLLGVFLGMFGIHKFYLGYNTAGFIMLGVAIIGGLFTFGLATSVVWLIGLIEGVIYLIKSQAEFEQSYVFKKREWF